ncbi:hypothetical protein O1M54_13040 [Streptomyces diastatochromogenes]|nr:hypothetical protein [Streptomyces diastatochromogenes]
MTAVLGESVARALCADWAEQAQTLSRAARGRTPVDTRCANSRTGPRRCARSTSRAGC